MYLEKSCSPFLNMNTGLISTHDVIDLIFQVIKKTSRMKIETRSDMHNSREMKCELLSYMQKKQTTFFTHVMWRSAFVNCFSRAFRNDSAVLLTFVLFYGHFLCLQMISLIMKMPMNTVNILSVLLWI